MKTQISNPLLELLEAYKAGDARELSKWEWSPKTPEERVILLENRLNVVGIVLNKLLKILVQRDRIEFHG